MASKKDFQNYSSANNMIGLLERRPSKLQKLVASTRLRKELIVSEDSHWHATLSMNGLNLDAYDRQGLPKTNCLMFYATFARVCSLNFPYDEFGSTFLDWSSLSADCMVFASASKLTMGRHLYDLGVSKSVLDCKTSLGHVGNSSFALVIDIFAPDHPEPIFQQINELVYVDMATRRPKPLPDWFKEKYKGKGILDKSVIVEPMERPAGAFVYDLKVAWSDTDFYNHTNYASYARFGVDAIHAALKDVGKRLDTTAADMADGDGTNSTRALQGLTEDVVSQGLKSVDICYLKESSEGQKLDVHVWQDEGFPYIVKCAIESNNVGLCHMTLEYFNEE